MTESHFIYLIPGFFGFTNLGRLRYFVHVHERLRERFTALGIPAQIHVVHTHPTASLPLRAARVVDTIAETMGRRSGVVHLIGHSSGGLDARLAATPDVQLPTTVEPKRYADRIRSVITVATPHHGSPLAGLLATHRGQRLLAFLSLSTAYVLRFGHLPLTAILSLATAFGRAEVLRMQRTLLDDISQQLLADFSLPRRRAVQRLLREVTEDQSLLVQLMAEAMEVFNATVCDRPGIRYGCVVTRGRPPGVRSTLATGMDPAAQAMHATYQALYRLTARPWPHSGLVRTGAQRRALRRAYGRLPGPGANDGIVPTQSQIWGTIVAAVRADHLDVIGHFNDPVARPPHFDWLTTQSGFTAEQFETLWDAVAATMLERPTAKNAKGRAES